MNEVVIWLIVVAVGLANFYMGRLIAIWDIPQLYKRPSPMLISLAVFIIASGVVFFIWNQKKQVYLFSTEHAGILSGVFLGSYISFRYGPFKPPRSYSESFNTKIGNFLQICYNHEWDLSSRNAINSLACSGKLHFDEGDYDAIVQGESDIECELGHLQQLPMAAGTPDYDRACAQIIVSYTNALRGMDSFEGMVTRVERDYDLSDFDRNAYQKLIWVSDGLMQQWGLDGLYGYSKKSNP